MFYPFSKVASSDISAFPALNVNHGHSGGPGGRSPAQRGRRVFHIVWWLASCKLSGRLFVGCRCFGVVKYAASPEPRIDRAVRPKAPRRVYFRDIRQMQQISLLSPQQQYTYSHNQAQPRWRLDRRTTAQLKLCPHNPGIPIDIESGLPPSEKHRSARFQESKKHTKHLFGSFSANHLISFRTPSSITTPL